MKVMNYASKVVLAIVVIAGLGACSKKKNGSVAATPASVCTYTAQGYINAQGLACSPTANQCTFNGSAYVYPGTNTPCSPQSQCTMNQFGQYVNNLGQACTPYPQVPNYPSQYQTGQQYGCNQWTYTYGIQYVPVYLQGGLQCVRIDLLQSGQNYPASYYNSGYYDYGYDYYYAYPPYTGSGCQTQINFGGSWGNLGVCF